MQLNSRLISLIAGLGITFALASCAPSKEWLAQEAKAENDIRIKLKEEMLHVLAKLTPEMIAACDNEPGILSRANRSTRTGAYVPSLRHTCAARYISFITHLHYDAVELLALAAPSKRWGSQGEPAPVVCLFTLTNGKVEMQNFFRVVAGPRNHFCHRL